MNSEIVNFVLAFALAVLITIPILCQAKKTKAQVEHFREHNKTFDNALKRFNADGDPSDFLEGHGRLADKSKADKSLYYHISGSDHAQAIAIQVENYSNKLLGDGQVYINAGYKWPDKKPKSIPPGGKDVTIYSDNNHGWMSCGGSVSWQIKENVDGNEEGGKYEGPEKNKGPRIAFSWYINEVSPGQCSNSRYTDMAFSINENHRIDERGNWKNPTQDTTYHTDKSTFSRTATSKHHHAKHQQRISLKELNPGFRARAIVSNGCKVTVRIQLLGTAPGTQLVTEEGGIDTYVSKALGLKGEEGTPLVSILVMGLIGVAGLILVIVILKTIITINNKRKQKKKHGQTEYRKVSTEDMDEE